MVNESGYEKLQPLFLFFALLYTQSFIKGNINITNMAAFRPIFNTIFAYSVADDALDLFFKSAWNKYQYNQKERAGEPYVTCESINYRGELGKKRLAKLYADAVDVEFVELK